MTDLFFQGKIIRQSTYNKKDIMRRVKKMKKTFEKRAKSVIVNNISDELGGVGNLKNLKKCKAKKLIFLFKGT